MIYLILFVLALLWAGVGLWKSRTITHFIYFPNVEDPPFPSYTVCGEKIKGNQWTVSRTQTNCRNCKKAIKKVYYVA